jgi:hypothetical protein
MAEKDEKGIVTRSLDFLDFIGQAKEIEKAYQLGDRLEFWFRQIFRQDIQFLFVGAAGVGKSSIVDAITSKEKTRTSEDRTREVERTRLLIKSNAVIISDTPGSLGTAETLNRRREVLKPQKQSKSILISVVSFGLHETGPVLRRLKSDGGYTQIHRDENVQAEIFAIKDVADLQSHEYDWALTIVNKADLWWDEKAAVESCYDEGSLYWETFKTIRAQHHVICYYSCHRSLIANWINLAATFDDRARAGLVVRFGDLLSQFLGSNPSIVRV